MSDNLIIIADRVKETSLTVGTGDLALGGVVGGFSAFSDVYASGDALFYAVTDGTNYEVGSGIFHYDQPTSLNSVQRFPTRSSLANNGLVDFPQSTKEVYVTYPATHSVYIGSGVADLNFPQASGLAFWSSSNILNYDNDIVWDSDNHRLGILSPNPSYGIEVGGNGFESSVQASGFYVGSSGVVFPAQNNGDATYAGGNQLLHFEKNQTNSETGSDLVIELSGVVDQVILLKQQNKGTVFAGPASGCPGDCDPNYPEFRYLTLEDIPDLSSVYSSFSDLQAASGAVNTDSIARSGNLQSQIDDNLTSVNSDVSTVSGALTADVNAVKNTFDVVKSGGEYEFSNVGTSTDLNPNIFLQKGLTYYFNIDSAGTPFYVKTAPVVNTDDVFDDGVTGNGITSGILTFVVPQDAPDILYYTASNISTASGIIYTADINLTSENLYANLASSDSQASDKIAIWDSSASEYKNISLESLLLAPSGNSYIKRETIASSSTAGDLGEITFDDTYAYFKTSAEWKRVKILPFQTTTTTTTSSTTTTTTYPPACTTLAPDCGNQTWRTVTGTDVDGCPEYSSCATTTTTTAAPTTTTTTTTTTLSPSDYSNFIYTWGYNGNNQLGYRTSELFSLSPTKLDIGNVSELSAGDFHVLAIDIYGDLYSWGWNINGQVGDGTKVDAPVPVEIGSGKDWSSVAAGDHHSAAIDSTGALYTWGANNLGQLGNGNRATVLTPTRIAANVTWSKVFCGTAHTLAISSIGELYAWGSNEYGQVGNGTFTDVLTPTKVGVENNWTTVSAYMHTLALNSEGQCFAWGRNDAGQLGLHRLEGTSPLFENQNSPQQISKKDTGGNVILNAGTVDNWKAVAAGYQHSLAINNAGELYVCGNNEFRQLGRAGITQTIVPGVGTNPATTTITQEPVHTFTRLGLERNWNKVAAGNFHSIIISAAGDMYAMGRNNYGQLGDGTTDNKDVLTLISTDFDWDFPQAGYDFTTAIGNSKMSNTTTTAPPSSFTNSLTAAANGQATDTTNGVTFLAPENDKVDYNVPASSSALPLSADIYIGGSYTFTFTANAQFVGQVIRYTPASGSPVIVTLADGRVDA